MIIKLRCNKFILCTNKWLFKFMISSSYFSKENKMTTFTPTVYLDVIWYIICTYTLYTLWNMRIISLSQLGMLFSGFIHSKPSVASLVNQTHNRSSWYNSTHQYARVFAQMIDSVTRKVQMLLFSIFIIPLVVGSPNHKVQSFLQFLI